VARSDEDEEAEGGLGSLGDFMPTFVVLLIFTAAWGLIQFRDGTPWIGLALTPPVALGVMSAAAVRMILGRNIGGLGMTFGIGAILFMMMYGFATGLGMLTSPVEGGVSISPLPIALGLMGGLFGALLGALSLKHYVVGEESDIDEDEDLQDSEEEDIDYSTEPEDLVCLLTNQVVNRDHDRYVVCHSRMNVTSVCHAVYLHDYIHLLDGRCRRCYQPLRERDLKGMGG
jgi:hypothetical protein